MVRFLLCILGLHTWTWVRETWGGWRQTCVHCGTRRSARRRSRRTWR